MKSKTTGTGHRGSTAVIPVEAPKSKMGASPAAPGERQYVFQPGASVSRSPAKCRLSALRQPVSTSSLTRSEGNVSATTGWARGQVRISKATMRRMDPILLELAS